MKHKDSSASGTSDPHWDYYRWPIGNDVLLVRLKKGLRRWIGHPNYRHTVHVLVDWMPMSIPESLPKNHRSDVEIKLQSCLEAKHESILAIVLSSGAGREYVFYTSNPDIVGSKISLIDSKLLWTVQRDPSWGAYKRFPPMVPERN